MQKETINRRATHFFTSTANDLVYNQEKFVAFIHQPFSKEAFTRQLLEKENNYSLSHRRVLVDTLEKDYESVSINQKTKKQLSLLSEESTFTVTTGHQLNLYTGPLYFIYKIFHVIKLAEELKHLHPDKHFIPVYWMASEDHDFEEIKQITLFDEKYSWNTNQKGAVGSFNLDDFDDFKNSLSKRFENDDTLQALIQSNYKDTDTLSKATFRLVHELFSDYGLIIIDANKRALKTLFSTVMEKELKSQFSNDAVIKTTEKLVDLGYKAQVTPRAINLFYIDDNNHRERIIFDENENFLIGDQKKTLSQLLKELKYTPEKFSPNVVLRPVYQEFILPNLAYVGGGGEITYWLQLKGVFDAVNLTYPLIQVRNSIQLFDKNIIKKLNKLNIATKAIFDDIHQLKKTFVIQESKEELDFSELESVGEQLSRQMEDLVATVDKGLVGYGKSEASKIQKQVNQLKQKMIRHQKKKFDDTLSQIDAVYTKLFPDNTLQERKENMLEWMAKIGKEEYMSVLYRTIEPFEKDLIILKDQT